MDESLKGPRKTDVMKNYAKIFPMKTNLCFDLISHELLKVLLHLLERFWQSLSFL